MKNKAKLSKCQIDKRKSSQSWNQIFRLNPNLLRSLDSIGQMIRLSMAITLLGLCPLTVLAEFARAENHAHSDRPHHSSLPPSQLPPPPPPSQPHHPAIISSREPHLHRHSARLSSVAGAPISSPIYTAADATTNDYSDLSSILIPRSNLSCYVCDSINDLECKFGNKSNIGGGFANDDFNNVMFTGDEDDDGDNKHGPVAMPYRRSKPNIRFASSVMGLATGSQQYGDNGNDDDDGDGFYNSFQTQEPELSSEQLQQLELIFGQDCGPKEHYCVVMRLGVSEKENHDIFKFFALKRGCSDHCIDGCFIIGKGERTLLSFCSTCCTTDYCNVGNSAPASNWRQSSFIVCLVLSFLLKHLVH